MKVKLRSHTQGPPRRTGLSRISRILSPASRRKVPWTSITLSIARSSARSFLAPHISGGFPSTVCFPVSSEMQPAHQVFLNLVPTPSRHPGDPRQWRTRFVLGRKRQSNNGHLQDDGVGIRSRSASTHLRPLYTNQGPGGGTGLGISICMSSFANMAEKSKPKRFPPAVGLQPSSPLSVDQLSEILSAPWKGRAPHLGSNSTSAIFSKSRGTRDPPRTMKRVSGCFSRKVSCPGLRVDVAATRGGSRSSRTLSYDGIICDLHLSSGGYAVGSRGRSRIRCRGSPKPAVVYRTGGRDESIQGTRNRVSPSVSKAFRIVEC